MLDRTVLEDWEVSQLGGMTTEMCSNSASLALVVDIVQTPKLQLSMLGDCSGLVMEAFVYCWQVMRIWERKVIMGKLRMLIWMMTGVLTMSKTVSRMLCWHPANW